jgi:hypothetical protein
MLCTILNNLYISPKVMLYGLCVSRISAEVAAQFAGEVGDGGEDAACDHVPLDLCEPQFNLIQLDE